MNIMDPVFNGMGRSEFYRSLLFPELFPHEQPMLLCNWSRDDLEMYCGGVWTQLAFMREILDKYPKEVA